MKALIAAGGRATRLRPITHTINKHLIPLANKPMIFYAIEKVTEIGIKDIIININPGETEIQKAVGDGGQWGAKIVYAEQRGGPLGLAHIVKNAEDLLVRILLFFISATILFWGALGLFMKNSRAKTAMLFLLLLR